MHLLDGGNLLEQHSYLSKALFPGFLCKAGIHVCPLIVLALSCIKKILLCSRDFPAMQKLEPYLGMLLLIVCRLLEKVGYLDIPVLLGLGGIIGVFVASLRLAGKCGLEIGLGLCSFQIFH